MPLIETKGAASAQGFGEFAKTGVANYIEDVFSTYLYTGNGTSQTITNGIDLAGKGGLIWAKSRTSTNNHGLYDSARGFQNVLNSASTIAQQNYGSTTISSVSSTGFSIGSDIDINSSGNNFVSWTFRKQAKFFDVVTYTGNGSNRTIAHSLGSVPGCIIVKSTISGGNWFVYHRATSGSPQNEELRLNSTAATNTNATAWNNTAPTSTVFSLGTGSTNINGEVYVAYLFAHDAGGFGLTGTDNVISCGAYTGNGSMTVGPTVNLGWEPQWLLVKAASTDPGYPSNRWSIIDNMRGWKTSGDAPWLMANTSDSEQSSGAQIANITSTGFTAGPERNESGVTFIYIAIRRGPMKTPTSGTSVYEPVATTGNGTAGRVLTAGFPVDLDFGMVRNSGGLAYSTFVDRLRGATKNLYGGSTQAEYTDSTGVTGFDNMTGVVVGTGSSNSWPNQSPWTYISWMLRRAPGFFDVVCYTGTGSNTTQTHNLGVVPELMLVKRRGAAGDWQVYSAALSNTEYLVLNTTAAKATGTTRWNSTTPTASVFSLGTDATVNASGSTGTYVAYLFATVAGVSKVGSYTGTGTTKQIDCGFTGGARFVLIKRTDSTGDWYVWDSARGIVSGNDPYLLLNSTDAEVTTTDYVDTYSAGFEISSTAPAAINANGGSFIFLAIA